MTSAIYALQHSDGRRYIGRAQSFRLRKSTHLWELRSHRHSNPHLQRTWDRDGESQFHWVILLECEPKDLVSYEQLCIDGLRPEFNISPYAACGYQTGHRWSEKDKAKLRAAAIRRFQKPEERKKLSAARTGIKFSEEHRRNLSRALLGKPGPRKGKERSAETKAKLRAALKGRSRSPEAIAKHRATNAAKRLMIEVKGQPTP